MDRTRNLTNTLPNFATFSWLFFMQPVQLYQYLNHCGVEQPDAPIFNLWCYHDELCEIKRDYVLQLIKITLVVVPLLSFCGVVFFSKIIVIAHPLNFINIIFGVLMGMLIGGLIGLLIGAVNGFTASSIAGILIGFFAVFYEYKQDILKNADAIIVITGFMGGIWGFIDNITFTLANGYIRERSNILTTLLHLVWIMGVFSGAIMFHEYFTYPDWKSLFERFSQLYAILFVPSSIMFVIMYLRIPLYLLESIWQTIIYYRQLFTGIETLHLSPILYHNLSYFSYPYLAKHCLLSKENNPIILKKVLDISVLTNGQKSNFQKILASLQIDEINYLIKTQNFKQLAELRGQWLSIPHQEVDSPLLIVKEFGRYLQAASHVVFAYHRLQNLKDAEIQLKKLETQLHRQHSPLGKMMNAQLATWKNWLETWRIETEQIVSKEVPNPFRAGEPLTPERGSEVFRGRTDLIMQIEGLLADTQQRLSIALLGPRRVGKTSLLYMLPSLIPHSICIFFDLQDNPIDKPTHFFQALSRRIKEQIPKDRKIKLPILPINATLENASEWLRELDHSLGDQQLLISIDEFERLESVFPGNQLEFLQLMGIFRSIVQHRRNICLLLAGVAPFDELDSIWTDHFINVREVKIGFLPKKNALELLMRPVIGFPSQAISETIAETIFERTAGQPLLLQFYGSRLVQILNEQNRREATLKDIEKVEDRALEEVTYYFRNLYQTTPKHLKPILEQLAYQKIVELERKDKYWLRRRLLINEHDQLTIPVFATWIREYLV
ncbi:MAG: hypothetical protein RIT27_502 [Pseudomonadota bacterium]|jgi:hypothetical protein